MPPRDPVVVVGVGQVADAVRRGLGAADVSPVDPDGWPDDARRLVVVAPAGEFGAPRAKTDAEQRARLALLGRRAGEAAVAAGIEHVVAVTSAAVHGATPGRAVIEDDDPVAVDDAPGFAGDVAAFEDALREALRGVPLGLVRPAVVVGPGIDTLLTRHFEAPRLLTVRGGERTWQLVHVEDVVSAVRVALDGGLVGGLTAGPLRDGLPDELDSETVAAAAGLRTVQLPPATAFGAAERLHRVGVLPSPANDLAFVVHPWSVSAGRLHGAGWEPTWTGAAALEVLLAEVRGRVGVAGIRFGGRDAAALGAAGAAVAALGTAAVWRQARARKP
ncbi:NAD-dependent epimerase/dehydratase family protein [Cellulosimicrobium protaetiae]|uniref:Nucleoside-diphosphate sugar epimerase n=1 Tax=Cellulosimicrobium protaetiae TaxID=2587808 RepID=A0A6M5UJN6_9MICO|nr:NAD-dependent epimerase/dehydratase family protein [Cellulosimicrobium protaetiae]QJW37431.1 nucleoside-diphosphate sugar epimerase [Cellulosimicrobium protaetiae]